MSHSILLRGAKQLLTLRGVPGVRRGSQLSDLAIIEDGSVFIKAGKIHSVGPTRRLENLKEARGAIQIPAHNCVVMPGLIDPYMRLTLHAPGPAGRTRRRKLSDFSNDLITLMRSCLQHGTLNAGLMASSGYASLSADLSVLRQVQAVGDNLIGARCAWRPNLVDAPSPEALREALVQIVKRKLADSVEVKGDDENAGRVAFLNAGELPMNLDWSSAAENLDATLRRLQPVSVFCHHHLSREECRTLAQSAVTAVFKAGEALLDDQPGGTLRDLVDAGGAVALGSGYDAVNEQNFNMQLVLALAVRRLHLTIEQAITATTVNAAYALNCGDELGSLEPGKRADVLILNINDYRDLPRRVGVNHVAMAIRKGVLVINRTRWKVGAA